MGLAPAWLSSRFTHLRLEPALEIVTKLLSDYPQLRFEFDVTQELPRREICTQYRDSDLEFLTHLLPSVGLNWRSSTIKAEMRWRRTVTAKSNTAWPSLTARRQRQPHRAAPRRNTARDKAVPCHRPTSTDNSIFWMPEVEFLKLKSKND